MKFASYMQLGSQDTSARYGVVTDGRVHDLSTSTLPSLRSALDAEGLDGLMHRALKCAGPGMALSSITLLPPIPQPEKILCVGLNFYKHAEEAGMAVPSRPSIFVRFASSLVGHETPVTRPRLSEQFDYEAELAVVIGRRAHQIDEAAALDVVAGYTCLAENSLRDWQRHSNQATPGKNFVHSGACGPWLVTPDEAGPVTKMTVAGRLNGEIVQSDSGDQMIFSVAHTISYLSQFTELVPGDVISMGTPAGVGFTRKPPRYLRPGDVFEVDITGVGVLRNTVVQGN